MALTVGRRVGAIRSSINQDSVSNVDASDTALERDSVDSIKQKSLGSVSSDLPLLTFF